MGLQLFNLTPSEQLGAGYTEGQNVALRATFEPNSFIGALDGTTNYAFRNGMDDVIDAVKALGYVLPLNTEPTLPDEFTAVLDLHVLASGRQKSVAELVDDLQSADWRVSLRRLERIDIKDATTTGAAASRAATQHQEAAAREKDSTLAELEKVAKWVAVLALVLGVAALLVYGSRLRAQLVG